MPLYAKIMRILPVCVAMVLFFLAGSCVTEDGGSIVVEPGELTILEGDTHSLSFVLPAGSEVAEEDETADVVWESSDEKVAVVSPKGLLIAIKEGQARIRVLVGKERGTMTVTVVKPTVRLENIWIGKVLFEQGGKAVYGNPAEDDLTAQWIIEDAEGFKRVKNRGTGHYLSVENGEDFVEVLDKASESALWRVTPGSIAGGNTFESVRDKGYYLHVEGKKGYAQADNSVQPSWTSPQWRILKIALPDPKAVRTSLDTLIKNGDFSLSDTAVPGITGQSGTSYWSFGQNMGNGGGKATARLETGVLRVDVQAGGDYTYAIQLIQTPVTIEKDRTYMVSFDARADKPRGIEVKVGGTEDRAWADYTGGEGTGRPLDIGTDMKTYSLFFTMHEDTDQRARLEFQLGGKAPSTIWLDDIRLESFSMENLVRNGGFTMDEEGAPRIQYVSNSSHWFFGADMGGAGGDAISYMDPSGAIQVDIKDPGRDVYAIQLIQSPLVVAQGARYRLSFSAKASEARTIDVKVGGVGDRNWTDYTKGDGNGRIVAIGTEMERHTFEFTMSDPTDHHARLEFQLGGMSTSSVWLDDIELIPIALDAEPDPVADAAVWKPLAQPVTVPSIGHRGAATPFKQYDAELARTNGQIIGPDRAVNTIAGEAVGRQAVRLDKKGHFVEFTLAEPANAMVVRYSIPDSADGKGRELPISLYVDDVLKKTVTLTSKHAWVYGAFPWTNDPGDGGPRKFFDEVNLLLDSMPAGTRIKLQKDADNTFEYYIDLIDAELVGPPLNQPAGYLSIIDFGARPDDGKDDTSAIERAIAEGKKTGNGVWIPRGVFDIPADKELYAEGVTIQGSGMWYSVLNVGKQAFYGTGETFQLRDLAIFGNATQRDDGSDENGFKGNAGKGSLIENVWFHRLKVGIWTELGTDGLTVRDSRFRNLLADGINFCLGTSNSVLEQSHFRGTGDDAIAIWSGRYNNNEKASSGNTIRFNTVQSPWLANGIAVYGGNNHSIEDNVIYDTIVNGAGINISSNFDPVPFGGHITVRRNTLVRTGSPNTASIRTPRGAIWIWAANQDIDTDLRFQDIEIYDSSYSGISIEGRRSLIRADFERITIDGAGAWGLHLVATAKGAARFTAVRVKNARLGGVSDDSGLEVTKREVEGW